MKLLLATTNKHKQREIEEVFAAPGIGFVGPDTFDDIPEVVEDGNTFKANAIKKARVLALHTGLWALADDSGLKVTALGGQPGVYSSRFAGKHGDDAAKCRKLLGMLSGNPDRTARFVCAVALSSPKGIVQTVEGTCSGMIAEECLGDNGFGYDPVFMPEGYSVTFAQMEPAEKNRISHRARALKAAHNLWFQYPSGLSETFASSSSSFDC